MRLAVPAAILTVITFAILGISQLALPRGLAATEDLPPHFTDFTHQTSGYLHIEYDGPSHLALACDMRARLVAGSARFQQGIGGIFCSHSHERRKSPCL